MREAFGILVMVQMIWGFPVCGATEKPLIESFEQKAP